MSIYYHETARMFHLKNASSSMVLTLYSMPDGSTAPLMRYYGAPLKTLSFQDQEMQMDGFVCFDTVNAVLPFALPTAGHGDYRPVQLGIRGADGDDCTRLDFCDYEILEGKEKLEGLPATYTEHPGDAQTLRLTLRDSYTQAEVRLDYTVFENPSAIAVSMRVSNLSDGALMLEQAASVSVDLPQSYELLHLHGAWARECEIERTAPMYGERCFRSNRGASGHEHNPFAALVSHETTEFSGPAYGMSLIYSGNYAVRVHQDSYGHTRAVIGLDSASNRWTLEPGERFQTPEAVLVYSDAGLNGMSQLYHKLYRTRLCRGPYRDKPRPILVNNWEATYFDFDEASLLKLAEKAVDLGVELFVLDDGWFGRRNDATCSLGDWVENREKLPNGLRGLSDKLHEMNLLFGLWLEPEMISADSDLYRAHPDWALHASGRYITQSRSQYVLDMSRADVQDYLISTVSGILENGNVDYVKWDMNRNFAEAGSALLPAANQPELPHRYILGLYRVLEVLTARHPNVLFEDCSGGGGRCDPGMLYYMPQVWVSDNSDAVSRLGIQYGVSMVYPASAVCSHVSASPNHQLQRITDLSVRGHVAMSGVFGYQLDFTKLPQTELDAMRIQIVQEKEIRRIVQLGEMTRLISPFEGDFCAWQFVLEDEIVVFAFRVLQKVNYVSLRLRLHGIPEGTYQLTGSEDQWDERSLCESGLYLPFSEPMINQKGDFQSAMLHLKKI